MYGRELIWLPAAGGGVTSVAPVGNQSGYPHFARGDNERIYVAQGQAGLVSMRFDGTDRKTHLRVTGNPDYRSATIGYCRDEAAWGQGLATEAADALLQWAFDTLDLNRVQAETDTRNAASARVLEKLGFVREGTLREDCVVNGEVSDSWVYGLIKREWRPSSEPVPAR